MVALKALPRRRTRIGLDLGAAGVRAVQLTRSADGYRVANAAHGDRPRTAEPDSADARPLAGDIAECVRRTSFRGKAVAAALASPDVEFHTLELPAAALHADEGEAAQIVRFEVERLMSGAGGPFETRHWALPETTVAAPSAIGVGAAHAIINRTVEACTEAGFTCADLDTSATALCRFGAVLHTWPHDQVWGVLDVGDRQTRLVLCLDDTPVLVRTTGPGGRAWTQRVADALQLSFKAAEIHKRDHGIALTGRLSAVKTLAEEGARSELASLILGAVRADLNEIAAEIKRSYEYVLSCYPGRCAGDLVLCGGGSALRNLPEFLGKALGIPVRRASTYLDDPSCRLQTGVDRPGAPGLELLALAVGLAVTE
jgi:Tfp pilus assembly PilM family ATPase